MRSVVTERRAAWWTRSGRDQGGSPLYGPYGSYLPGGAMGPHKTWIHQPGRWWEPTEFWRKDVHSGRRIRRDAALPGRPVAPPRRPRLGSGGGTTTRRDRRSTTTVTAVDHARHHASGPSAALRFGCRDADARRLGVPADR